MSSFFVYVVESNKPEESNFCEGEALSKVLGFSEVPCRYLKAPNKAVVDFLVRTLSVPTIVKQQAVPIIHLSAHGNEHGVALTSKEFITWKELAGMLVPIQKLTGGNYLLAMSSCKGLTAVNIPILTDIKMYGIVGSLRKTPWSDNVVGFAAFYHLLQKGRSLDQAVEGMRAASGNPDYHFVHAPTIVETHRLQTGFSTGAG